MRRFLCEVPSGGTPFPTPIGQTQEPTASPISCDADPNTIAEVGGKTVEYFTNFKTWDDAQSCCEERKGNLLTVESAAENDFAKNLQLKTPMLHAWIGLRWNGDQFQWADEAKSSNDFLAWGLQQPAMTTDHAAVQRHDTGKWVSVGMTARRRFLCEVPGAGTPMPTMSSPTQEPTMCSPTQAPTTSNPTQELTTSSPTQAPSSAALPITRMCAEGRITTTDLITPERLEGGTTASLSEIDVNLPNLSTFYMCRFTFDLDLTENESTICSTSDDGSKVFLNGEEVVDNDGRHPVRTVCSDPIQTSGGAFVVDFFQLKGKSILNVTINGMTPGELLG
uniref:C-type lectin domain-containing protein n=2 Tax=Lotharella globosa TaxID=91324 RepID=A0A7S3YNL2_9EUKA